MYVIVFILMLLARFRLVWFGFVRHSFYASDRWEWGRRPFVGRLIVVFVVRNGKKKPNRSWEYHFYLYSFEKTIMAIHRISHICDKCLYIFMASFVRTIKTLLYTHTHTHIQKHKHMSWQINTDSFTLLHTKHAHHKYMHTSKK